MRKVAQLLVIPFILSVLTVAPANAALPDAPKANVPVKVRAVSSHSRIPVSQTFELSGTVKPARKGIIVERKLWQKKKWIRLNNSRATTNKNGEWKMVVTAPSRPQKVRYQIKAINVKKSTIVETVVNVVPPRPAPSIAISTADSTVPSAALTNIVGTFQDAGKTISIQAEQLVAEVWTPVQAQASVGRTAWVARLQLPIEAGIYQFRINATTARGAALSNVISFTVLPPALLPIDALGPGSPSRIWGIDISRWQHMADTNGDGVADLLDDGKPIDFEKAYRKGLRFVFIKASDGTVKEDGSMFADNYAKKFAAQDKPAAQAAGLFTGLYHFPGMIHSDNKAKLIADAREEAIQATIRLAELGGYNEFDLPYVLDVERDDIPKSGIADGVKKSSVNLWVKTWLLEMQARTGRMPIVYSAPNFLGTRLIQNDPFWDTITLWMARYYGHPTKRFKQMSHDGAISLINAGGIPVCAACTNGQYQTPWTNGADIAWSFWQYSSMASGKNFGIKNGSRLDMNVFRGTSEQFRALAQGTWVPFEGDYVANSDAIDLQVTPESEIPNQLIVSAKRLSNFAACVTGKISVRIDGKKIKGAKVELTGLGTWLVTLPEMEAGTYLIDFGFSDSYNFYAPTTLQVEYLVEEAETDPIVP
jgi:GH25 family lysozyme M1 (1,4-beta-N-acetylmuramidase)